MPNPYSDEDLEPIRRALQANNKIKAIKLYRELSGAGLAEAKRFVEALPLGLWVSDDDIGSISDAAVEQIQSAIFAGRKIEAIKLYRKASGLGLVEAKEFIDALEAELRRTDPTRFTAPEAKGCGATVLCLLLVLGILFAVAG